MIGYYLFLDDERTLDMAYGPRAESKFAYPVLVARSTDEAKHIVENVGWPTHMLLDHDLGGDDTTMVFLRWLAYEKHDGEIIPDYTIHSANPVGASNINGFMRSWARSCHAEG